MPAAHEPLDRVDRPRRVGDRLPAGGLADEDVALVGERDDARRQAVAFRVRDDLRLVAFHHGDDRVGRAQVDADNFFACSHVRIAPFILRSLVIDRSLILCVGAGCESHARLPSLQSTAADLISAAAQTNSRADIVAKPVPGRGATAG